MRNPLRVLLVGAVAGGAVLLPLIAAVPAQADLLPTDERIVTTFTPGGPLEEGVPTMLNIYVTEKPGGDPGGLQGRADITITTPAGSQHHVRQVHAMNAAWSYPVDTSVPGPVNAQIDFVPADGYGNEVAEGSSVGATIAHRPTISTDANVYQPGDSVTTTVSDPDGMSGAGGNVSAQVTGIGLGTCAPVLSGGSQTVAACTLRVPSHTTPGIYSVPFTYYGSSRYATLTTTLALQITAASAAPAGSAAGGSTSGGSTGSTGSGATTGGSGRTSAAGAGTTAGGGVSGGGGAAGLGTAVGVAVPSGSPAPSAVAATPGPTEDAFGLPARQTTAQAAGKGITVTTAAVVVGVVALAVVLLVVLVIVFVVGFVRRRSV